MVQFGKHLETNMEAAWAEHYMRYEKLKDILERVGAEAEEDTMNNALSLSAPEAPGAAMQAAVTENDFFSLLEEDMQRVQDFTRQRMSDINAEIRGLEAVVFDRKSEEAGEPAATEATKARLTALAETFLRLEKFVNLNLTGFDKILKKHDKSFEAPCRAHYLGRLAAQPWVRGDYSSVMVSMSRMWERVRGDRVVQEVKTAAQNFTRRTTKYWVRTEDVTAVKARVLMHLPVFLQESMKGESDAQLVNSIYLDNTAMELYRGRLNKTPGAIALRLRWYGTATPDADGQDGAVFVERKTHLDKWAGGLSVKERFVLPASRIPELFNGTFDVEAEAAKMRTRGKRESDVEAWKTLAGEIYQSIASKMLVPTMRTQCYRTAFQIPFDATVRISLDTNLCMVAERTDDAVQVATTGRWFRDPRAKVPPKDITRFPHAILEVKLQLEDDASAPAWVEDLLRSGLVFEVHKYSKFTHGCAVLMSDEVRSLPYWVDDPSLEQSIIASKAERILRGTQAFRDANSVYAHLLPFREGYNASNPNHGTVRTVGSSGAVSDAYACLRGNGGGRRICRRCLGLLGRGGRHEDSGCGAICFDDDVISTPAHQKVEPKLLFANERTFLHWLQMSVSLTGLSAALLSFRHEGHAAHTYALLLLPVAFLFSVYAVNTWAWRGHRIRTRVNGRWDDAIGPSLMAMTLIVSLSMTLVVQISHLMEPDTNLIA